MTYVVYFHDLSDKEDDSTLSDSCVLTEAGV